MIGVVVREEDLLEVDEPDVAAQELALRPLGTVDEEPLAAAPDERRRQRSPRRRHRARRPEEDDVELHGGRLYSGAQSRPCASRYSLHAAPSRFRPSGLGRPLTLLRAFLVASAVILAVGADRALVTTLARSARGLARGHGRRHGRVRRRRPRAAARSRKHGRGHAAHTARASRERSTCPVDVRGLNVYARNGRLVFSTTHPDRIGRRRSSPDLRAAVKTNEPTALPRRPDGQRARDRQGVGAAARRTWACRRRSRGHARRVRRQRHDRERALDGLVRGRDRVRDPLARACDLREQRVGAHARPERGPRGAIARSRRVVARARGDAARDDRDPECRRRGSRPVHGGPLAARAARLARHRAGAAALRQAAGCARHRCALPRHRQDRDARLDPHEARAPRSAPSR